MEHLTATGRRQISLAVRRAEIRSAIARRMHVKTPASEAEVEASAAEPEPEAAIASARTAVREVVRALAAQRIAVEIRLATGKLQEAVPPKVPMLSEAAAVG